MPKHNQMRDLERRDRVFNRRRGAVMLSVRLVGRDEVGDIAVNKKFALIRAKDRGDMHPAVTAGNNHRPRMLSQNAKMPVP